MYLVGLHIYYKIIHGRYSIRCFYLYILLCNVITNIYCPNTNHDIYAQCRRCFLPPNFVFANVSAILYVLLPTDSWIVGNLCPEGMTLYEYWPNNNWVCFARDADKVKRNFYQVFGIKQNWREWQGNKMKLHCEGGTCSGQFW